MHNRFDRLIRETEADGWGSDAPGIPRDLWERARGLAVVAADEFPALPEPCPSPCADGSVHLTWTIGDRRALVEFEPGVIHWSLLDGDAYKESEHAHLGELMTKLGTLGDA